MVSEHHRSLAEIDGGVQSRVFKGYLLRRSKRRAESAGFCLPFYIISDAPPSSPLQLPAAPPPYTYSSPPPSPQNPPIYSHNPYTSPPISQNFNPHNFSPQNCNQKPPPQTLNSPTSSSPPPPQPQTPQSKSPFFPSQALKTTDLSESNNLEEREPEKVKESRAIPSPNLQKIQEKEVVGFQKGIGAEDEEEEKEENRSSSVSVEAVAGEDRAQTSPEVKTQKLYEVLKEFEASMLNQQMELESPSSSSLKRLSNPPLEIRVSNLEKEMGDVINGDLGRKRGVSEGVAHERDVAQRSRDTRGKQTGSLKLKLLEMELRREKQEKVEEKKNEEQKISNLTSSIHTLSRPTPTLQTIQHRPSSSVSRLGLPNPIQALDSLSSYLLGPFSPLSPDLPVSLFYNPHHSSPPTLVANPYLSANPGLGLTRLDPPGPGPPSFTFSSPPWWQQSTDFKLPTEIHLLLELVDGEEEKYYNKRDNKLKDLEPFSFLHLIFDVH